MGYPNKKSNPRARGTYTGLINREYDFVGAC
jgi:hypothetical protein